MVSMGYLNCRATSPMINQTSNEEERDHRVGSVVKTIESLAYDKTKWIDMCSVFWEAWVKVCELNWPPGAGLIENQCTRVKGHLLDEYHFVWTYLCFWLSLCFSALIYMVSTRFKIHCLILVLFCLVFGQRTIVSCE